MKEQEWQRGAEVVLVGVFAQGAQLEAAAQELEALGIARDFLGAIIADVEMRQAARLSVRVPRGRGHEVEEVLRRYGARAVGDPQTLEPLYGPAPHPGAWEDQDLKSPAGREYPETRLPPPLSGRRVPVPALEPGERLRHFGELKRGYTLELTRSEAGRCLLCPRPLCVEGCPARNDIPGFIRCILEGDFGRGVEILRRTTSFPGICGRVCDFARQCEGACVLGQTVGEPIAIGALERFLADWELEQGRRLKQAQTKPTGKKIAVVGSGPAGLAAAGDLALLGHQVTVYEALPVAGGALAWGIPAFRVPPHVLRAELDFLRALRVTFELGIKVGRDITVEELLEKHDAVLIAAGASVPVRPKIPGEDLEGVYTATEFLSRAKLSQEGAPAPLYQPPALGKKLVVTVIGAGNTAMDVAQTALRLGAQEVTAVDLLAEDQLPTRRDELEEAREEGVRLRFRTMPVRFIGDEAGHVRAVECVEVELSEPDAGGRRRPLPKPHTEFILEADTVVIAIGFRPDAASVLQGTQGITTTSEGLIASDPKTGRTSRPGVWAAGDIVSGPATVVRAMVAGKRAAQDIARRLRTASTSAS